MSKNTASDLRQDITRQMDNLDTAIELSEIAAKADIASSDSDPFPIVSLNDVLTFIAELRSNGRLNDEVVYMLARFPTNELKEQKRIISLQNSRNAQKPRSPRVTPEVVNRIQEIGSSLLSSGRARHEIASIVEMRLTHLGHRPSSKTIRKYLRALKIISEPKKRDT